MEEKDEKKKENCQGQERQEVKRMAVAFGKKKRAYTTTRLRRKEMRRSDVPPEFPSLG